MESNIMSDLRVGRILQALPAQVKSLSGATFDPSQALLANTTVGAANTDGYAGYNAAVVDATASTWASGNLRVIVIAKPAQDFNNTPALHTQSHAQGQYLTGSSSFIVLTETPASWTGAQAAFIRNVQFHLQGQMGAPVDLQFCANGTQPTVNQLNGATATAAFTDSGTYYPYGGGVGYVGGV